MTLPKRAYEMTATTGFCLWPRRGDSAGRSVKRDHEATNAGPGVLIPRPTDASIRSSKIPHGRVATYGKSRAWRDARAGASVGYALRRCRTRSSCPGTGW
jgi:hypothetical protein